MYVYMYVCVHEDWLQEAEDDVKGLPDTRDFDSLIKRIPVIEVSWKSINKGAEVFNKMCSFEVSVGLFPLISIISSKESLL